MLFILSDDMFDIVFINHGIPIHNSFRRAIVFCQNQDIQLVFKRNLGIRNQHRREQGMRFPAFLAANPLNRK